MWSWNYLTPPSSALPMPPHPSGGGIGRREELDTGCGPGWPPPLRSGLTGRKLAPPPLRGRGKDLFVSPAARWGRRGRTEVRSQRGRPGPSSRKDGACRRARLAAGDRVAVGVAELSHRLQACGLLWVVELSPAARRVFWKSSSPRALSQAAPSAPLRPHRPDARASPTPWERQRRLRLSRR